MEKKLYWLLEDNGDLSVYCESVEELTMLMEGEFESLERNEQEETQYTITPVWMTQQEYDNLPED